MSQIKSKLWENISINIVIAMFISLAIILSQTVSKLSAWLIAQLGETATPALRKIPLQLEAVIPKLSPETVHMLYTLEWMLAILAFTAWIVSIWELFHKESETAEKTEIKTKPVLA